MFICNITKLCSRPGVKPHRVVKKTREKIYYKTYRDEETGKLNTVEISRGFEIVEEVLMSDEGLRIWKMTNHDEPKVEEEKPVLKHRVMVPSRMGDK